MPTESNVAISPDSTSPGAHNVRTITVTPTVSPSTVNQGEQQQVITLADSDGNLVDATDGGLCTSDERTQLLLQALIQRMDYLCAAVDKNYRPPNDIAYEDFD